MSLSEINSYSEFRWFSQKDHLTTSDAQIRLRELDMSLYEGIKKSIGEKQTFVYSYLAGCCALAGTKEMSKDVQKFAQDAVAPIVKECFSTIESYHSELDNSALKSKLGDLLAQIQFYPKKVEFEVARNEKVFAILKERNLLTFSGEFTLYKLNPKDDKYQGARLEIDAKIGAELADILESQGFKNKGDELGSAHDRKWHISTVDPRDFAKSHDDIVAKHNSYITEYPKQTEISVVGIKQGMPQSGRLIHMVGTVVEIKNLALYRKSCGLPEKLQFDPLLTQFSSEVKPAADLKGRAIIDFANDSSHAHLQKLACILKDYSDKKISSVS